MKKTGWILIVSLSFNLIAIVLAVILLSMGEYRKIMKPYLGDYYLDRLSLFRILPKTRGRIVFLGDSLTDRCEWSELFDRCDVINRGIDADTTDGVLNRLAEVTGLKPEKIFIMIGGNDFAAGRGVSDIAENYRTIIQRIRSESPRTSIYIQSVLPTIYRLVPLPRKTIHELNDRIKKLSDGRNIFYIDIHRFMVDANGDLKSGYTHDGVHLNGRGYLAWRKAVYGYLTK
jgi:lysophospholipase L1-like esterase